MHQASNGSDAAVGAKLRPVGSRQTAEDVPATAPTRAGADSGFSRARAWLRDAASGRLFRKPLKPSKDGRRVPLRVPQGPDRLMDERRDHPYVSNAIRTSRYTLFDFFPKQIWFQFSRLSNFYFLCVGIPQTIPGISTTGNFTTILPLLFFVLLTIVKEGYDDYKRHKLDKVENARSATVLRRRHGHVSGNPASWPWLAWLWRSRQPSRVEEKREMMADGLDWRTVCWRDVQVGDVLRLVRDEDVPADMVLIQAESGDRNAYIETMALDGETNLKSKLVPAELQRFDAISDIVSCNAELVLEDPNPDLYRFDGRVTVDGKTSPLTLGEVLYRGSTLRNTPSAVGVVINTGEETKIRMNANRHPEAKKPALEKITNRIVLSLVAYVFSATAGCSVGYLLWQRSTEYNSWYLNNAGVAVQEIVIGYAIHFNNIIPLSLFITLEITKLFQKFMLNADIEMYDEASDTPAKCNTNTILENLGQVGYIFSDKTGTLTENVMKFRKMSVAGVSWLHTMDIEESNQAHTHSPGSNVTSPVELVVPGRVDAGKSVLPSRRSIAIPEDAELPSPPPNDAYSAREPIGTPITAHRRSSSQWRSTGRPDLVQPELTTEDLLEYMRLRPNSPFAKRTADYLLALALCHTCLPEVRDGEIDFQAASPDELALVRAAQELGFLVIQRSTQRITLQITAGPGLPPVEHVYEILDVIEFSSKRKRMSIIVRGPDGRLILICKGADSMIMPRLKLANLGKQKAHEARQSADLEREVLRHSEQLEPRSSLGGRPSLSLRHGHGVAHRHPEAGPSSGLMPPTTNIRSKSFEANKARRSADLMRPALQLRTLSFDLNRSPMGQSSMQHSPVPLTPLPAKFSLLEDASVSDDDTVFTRCFKHLDEFASEGLRTLLYAQRTIPEAEYASWKKLYLEATTSLVDRQDRIESVGEMIEQNLALVGATAIEDKLQKGVPETIDKLRRANIKIWMLTGDKRETAINIAHSARICKPYSDIHILDSARGDVESQLLGIADELRDQHRAKRDGLISNIHSVLVVDGHTLGEIEQSPILTELFYVLVPAVESVICCRASPAQKALLVKGVRQRIIQPGESLSFSSFFRSTSPKGTLLTLSIGDGGNDLAMLAEAHVGVGISGREGLQAARVADYSVAQFRFLARLLLVHGRWNYARTARFVLATFWKEMYFYTGTIAFQYFVGYTGTSLYEMWSLTALNTLFTSLCTISPALWEQDLSAATLLAVPELYFFGQRDLGLSTSKYLGWMIGGVFEGLVTFFGCIAGAGIYNIVGDKGLYAVGNLAFSVAMMWTNWKLLIIETHHKNWVILVSFIVTAGGWWVWQAFLSVVYAPPPSPYAVRGGLTEGFGRDLSWWLSLIVILAALVVVEMAYKALKRQLVVLGVLSRQRKFRKRLFGAWLNPRWHSGRSSPQPAAVPVPASSATERIQTQQDEDEEDLDLELWQELEQDPEIRARLEKLAWRDENADEPEGDDGIRDREVLRAEGVVI
ncbi:hypothetical protein RB596_001260 [Gaeumannomyces avenae]